MCPTVPVSVSLFSSVCLCEILIERYVRHSLRFPTQLSLLRRYRCVLQTRIPLSLICTKTETIFPQFHLFFFCLIFFRRKDFSSAHTFMKCSYGRTCASREHLLTIADHFFECVLAAHLLLRECISPCSEIEIWLFSPLRMTIFSSSRGYIDRTKLNHANQSERQLFPRLLPPPPPLGHLRGRIRHVGGGGNDAKE